MGGVRGVRKKVISDVSNLMEELDRSDIDSRYSSPDNVLSLMLIAQIRELTDVIRRQEEKRSK
ncbi:MAG: hypothetical protein CL678_08570 [Bdellovibrionaceae bacterium]|nr:hypothetical protein [Pseudobdellovibrionaceae bacterium]